MSQTVSGRWNLEVVRAFVVMLVGSVCCSGVGEFCSCVYEVGELMFLNRIIFLLGACRTVQNQSL